jgi:hypothetical protein
MLEFLSRWDSGEVIGLAAVLGGMLVVIIGTIAHYWAQMRRDELSAALKQEMLNRGMNADQIRQVLEANPKSAENPPGRA